MPLRRLVADKQLRRMLIGLCVRHIKDKSTSDIQSVSEQWMEMEKKDGRVKMRDDLQKDQNIKPYQGGTEGRDRV